MTASYACKKMFMAKALIIQISTLWTRYMYFIILGFNLDSRNTPTLYFFNSAGLCFTVKGDAGALRANEGSMARYRVSSHDAGHIWTV